MSALYFGIERTKNHLPAGTEQVVGALKTHGAKCAQVPSGLTADDICTCNEVSIKCVLAELGRRGISILFGDIPMSKTELFVERRPQGDYAVRRPNSERASDVLPTQRQAIERARELGAEKPLVERVRHTNVGKPDQWRKP
ncbi:DUF2188 domain-containing protein [Rhodanobacter ginsengisoli]|uniref:DUF2188 domain-containing protein n=1 Tax=Rhodanobacter ginsengisoli TaxID=418646 RepID=A0ABW0QSG5_9GAMM